MSVIATKILKILKIFENRFFFGVSGVVSQEWKCLRPTTFKANTLRVLERLKDRGRKQTLEEYCGSPMRVRRK